MRGGAQNSLWTRISREAAWTKQGNHCVYCHVTMKREDVTREHVKPRHAGGGDEPSNIRAACEPCNTAKGGKSLPSFKRAINGAGFSGKYAIDRIRVFRRIDRRTNEAVRRVRRCLA